MSTLNSLDRNNTFNFPGSPFSSPYLTRSDAPVQDKGYVTSSYVQTHVSTMPKGNVMKRSLDNKQNFCEELFLKGNLYEFVINEIIYICNRVPIP